MISGKKEIQTTGTDLKISRKTRIKRLVPWLIIDLIVMVIIFGLLIYRPGRYKPLDSFSQDYEPGQVSTYLTHRLYPQIYNGSQRGVPFEVTITQDGINDIISHANWPIQSEGIMLYAPAALFVPGTVVLMGTADIQGVEFVITIELEPGINENGLINLHVSKVKVGAMNITPLARTVAKEMYTERLAAADVDTNMLQTKIAASLLNDEPFEPVFEISDKKIRVENIVVGQQELRARLVPVSKKGL
jgi:hypothetical protein